MGICSEQYSPAGKLFVVSKDLLTKFVYKLVKAQVDLGLDFVVQELLPEYCEGVVSAVVVQIKGVQDKPRQEKETVSEARGYKERSEKEKELTPSLRAPWCAESDPSESTASTFQSETVNRSNTALKIG